MKIKNIVGRAFRVGLVLLCVLASASVGHATTYNVRTSGVDDAGRNGWSTGAAWKTLSYACSRVSAGSHTIQLGPGTFNETATSNVPAGVQIKGSGADGTNKTILRAPSSTWDTSTAGCTNSSAFYLIRLVNKDNCAVRDMVIEDISRKTNGAIYSYDSDNLFVYNVVIKGFRYAGIYLEKGDNVIVRDSRFYDTALNMTCDASNLGQITTKWLKNSQVFNNYFKTNASYGMGVRTRGNTNLQIHDNSFDIASGNFDIEVAHEQEFGVRIYNNEFKRPISVPKPANSPDPNSQGYSYSIRIDHNRSSSGYFVEGSRRFLEIDNNYVWSTTNRGQRFYVDYGGQTEGPVKIHHNVAVNVDRSFIYFEDRSSDKSRYLQNMQIFNNTIYFGADYSPSMANFYNAKAGACSGWEIKNNIVVSPSLSASWLTGATSTVSGIVSTNNVTQSVSGLPSGNFNNDPGLALAGAMPTPFYAPLNGSSFCVDKGVDVGFPFLGSAPDAGAYESDGTASATSAPSTSSGQSS